MLATLGLARPCRSSCSASWSSFWRAACGSPSALGLVGLLAMLLTTNVPIGAVLATTVWSASASWTLAALPLFIWMGEILFRTRLSEEMFRGLSPWLQWLPGRLMHVNVVGCGIFAAVSGSSAATCATIGKIALPELDKRGYDKRPQPRLARRLRHARPAHPAVDPDGGLRGHGERLGAAGLSRRLPARPARDGAVFRLHHRLVAAQSRQDSAARSADAVPCKSCGSRPSSFPCLLLILGGVLRAGSRLCDRDRMRRLGRDRRAAARLVERHARPQDASRQPDERDAADLHDHADPGGRRLSPPRRWPIPAFRRRWPMGARART